MSDMESHDQMIVRRAIRACGGRQIHLSKRLALRSSRPLVSLLEAGIRPVTHTIGIAIAAATLGTDDPIPYRDIFPALFEPVPTPESLQERIDQEDEIREREKAKQERKRKRREMKEQSKQRAAA